MESLGNFPALRDILLCGGQHQLDAVQLIHLAGAGVIVNGNDIGLRIAPSELFYDTFSDDVVRQAAKWLGTYNIGRAALEQLQHLAC